MPQPDGDKADRLLASLDHMTDLLSQQNVLIGEQRDIMQRFEATAQEILARDEEIAARSEEILAETRQFRQESNANYRRLEKRLDAFFETWSGKLEKIDVLERRVEALERKVG